MLVLPMKFPRPSLDGFHRFRDTLTSKHKQQPSTSTSIYHTRAASRSAPNLLDSPPQPQGPRFISPPLSSLPASSQVHHSRTHFTYTTKYHQQVLPKLAGPSNYAQWAANLERILTVQDLWCFVDPSPTNSPASFPTTDKVAARAYGHRRRRAFMVVLLACSWALQAKLANCSDPAVAWLILADFCEWAPRHPPVSDNTGKHRFEYAFEGCRFEVWWLEGSGNWDEWRLSIKAIIEAESLGATDSANLALDFGAGDAERRDKLSLAIVNICIEDGLRALVKKRGCRSGEEAIAVLERLCGRRRTESNKGLIDLQLGCQ